MTRFTKDEISQIITGVIQGKGPRAIAMKIGRKTPSVHGAIGALQKDKSLFQRMMDGESVDSIAQKYVDSTAKADSERVAKMAKARLPNHRRGTQMSRIEAKLDELLSFQHGQRDLVNVKAHVESSTTYDPQGKRRSIFG